MRNVTYIPPQVIVAPGEDDGTRVIVGVWPGTPDTIAVVLDEETAKTVAKQLLSPSLIVASGVPLPPHLADGI